MKTRVVVWTVAGLLVVAGVVFLLATSRRTPPVEISLPRIQQNAADRLAELEEFADEVAATKDAMASEIDAEVEFAPVERLIAQAREKLQAAAGAQQAPAAYDALREAQEFIREARRAYQQLEGGRPRPAGL